MTTQNESQTFPTMFHARTEGWKKAYDESHYPRTDYFVTLAKRNKGDYFGAMSQKRRHVWNGRLGKGLVTYPVVPRAIRSKTATAISTDIRLDFKSAVPDPEKEAGVQSAENIYAFLENLYWTEQLEMNIAQLAMFGGFMGVRAEIEDGAAVAHESVTAKKWMPVGETVFGCRDCGAAFDADELGLEAEAEPEEIRVEGESEGEEYDEPVQPGEPIKPAIPKYSLEGVNCPRCSKPTLVLDTEMDFEERDAPTGEFHKILSKRFEQDEVSALLIRYDDLNSIGFKWQKCHWFNYHPLRPVYEITSRRPKLKDKVAKTSYNDWSDSTRWYYEASKTNGNLGTSIDDRGHLDSYAETDFWYVQPIACKGWKETVGWTLFDDGSTGMFGEKREGLEIVFDINEGETIEAAFMRRDGEFRGAAVEMWQDHIIDIRNASFIDLWTLFGWQIDASSSHPMGEERLLNLQDAATNVLSMLYSMVLRFSAPKGVFDGKYFREGDLTDNQPGKWIATKQDIEMPEGANITNKVGYLVPPSPPSIIDMFVQLIIAISKEESGVFDETVGNVNPQNQTKGGRELAVNQSLSLMTPTQKAKKHGKIAWARMMLKLWQRFMPEEAYRLVKGTYEDEWKPQDVEAFKALDIDTEVLIDAIEGTDIPKHRSDYEQRYFAAVQMGMFNEPNPLPLEVRVKIIKTLGLVDVDIENYDADRRLAARRKDAIMETLDGYAQTLGGYDQLIVIVPDPATITPENPVGLPKRALHQDVKLTIAQDPRTKVCMEDRHLTFIGYYTDQLKGLRGAKVPKEHQIFALEDAIDSHRAMTAATVAQAASAEGVVANAATDQASMSLPAQKQEAMAQAEIQNANGGLPA